MESHDDLEKLTQEHLSSDLLNTGTILQLFDKWASYTETLEQINQNQERDLTALKRSKDELMLKNQEQEQSLKKYNLIISETQKNLHLLLEMKKENKQLKEDLCQQKADVIKLRDDMECQRKGNEECYRARTAEFEQERNKLLIESNTKMKIEVAKEKANTEIKQMEIEELKRQINQINLEKQSEIEKLTFEYEQKLGKMKCRSNIVSSSFSSLSHQEIFRQKLQHQKAEFEQEIKALKQKIVQLEKELSSSNGSGIISKKRKLFSA